MRNRCSLSTTVAALALIGAACSSNTASPPRGTGGSGDSGFGGKAASGGAGAMGSGGQMGGETGSGGQAATGGASATGGLPGSGGSSGAGAAQAARGGSGGNAGSGGEPATGGRASTGGRAGIGGRAGAGGAGGVATLDGGGAGGSTSTGGGSGTSVGCGSSNTTSPCSKSGTTCSLDVSGTTRTYYVQLPTNYDPSHAYPLVFQFHWMGGTAEQALTMYRLQSSGFADAIFVTPQGLTANGSTGWPNTNGQDIAFVKAMLADVQAQYCVDQGRIFSTGFSYGGMMSFAIGCEMSDVFRAIAPMSGALYSDFNCRGTGHPIAMWGSHGLSDNVVPIADGRAARDKILQEDHCGTDTVPVDPNPCVAYQGCDDGYPVTWCEWDGQHGIPSFGSSAIAAFFKQF